MAQGRLERSFPGRAIQLPADIFTDSKFSRELVEFLYRVHSEQIDEIMPEYQKAMYKPWKRDISLIHSL